MAGIDLHALIAAPYGVAERELKAAGYWDEGESEGDTIYTIKAEWSVGYRGEIEVQAYTEAQALEKAREMIRAWPDENGRVECVDIYDLSVASEK